MADSRLVVCDAGPLIHLDELNCLSLLADFSETLIPTIVWDEVKRHRPQAILNCQSFAQLASPKHSPPADLNAAIRLFSLHAGEIQALHIAQEMKADLLLTDDTAARLAAKSAGLAVHGTLGVLLRALRTQQLPQSEVLSILATIPERSSLHLRTSLLNEVVDRVKNYRTGQT